MDLFLFQLLNQLAGRFLWLDAFGVFLAKYLAYILVVLVFFIFWPKLRIIFQSFLAGILARFGVVELIRWIWPRPRPFVENSVNLLIDKINQSTLPSGHTAFFFALSTIIFLYNRKAGISFFVASSLIGIARIFCGVHWPSDIITGALVGVFSGWLIIKIFKKFDLK